METTNLQPGSAAWHAHRQNHDNASDAPAMLDCSPYESRAQFLRRRATGVAPEVDAGTQRRFDEGHRIERLLQPIAEAIIGDELAPVVGTSGRLSASFDGLTMLADESWECKTVNADLRAALPNEGRDSHARNDATLLPKHYRVQMEQQLLISGGRRTLFTAARVSDDGEVIEERHAWYYPDAELRAEILRGWEQFHRDLEAYVPEAPTAPVTPTPIEALPAVSVRMDGSLAVVSNLDVFGSALRAFVAKIPAKPTTDQEFADCDAACKALKRAEEALDGAEANALGQVRSVEELTRTIADLRAVARTARLASEKMVKARKEQIRAEEVQRGRDALAAHVAALNTRLGQPFMPQVPADFAGAIAGKKTLESLRNAIDAELARAKIAANEIADRIQVNMRALVAAGDAVHFPDVATLVLKAPEDLRAIIAARAAEAQRKLEAERERIRAEEAARLQREQEQREARERAAREAEERRQREEAEAAERARQREVLGMKQPAAYADQAASSYQPLGEAPAAGATVHPLPTRAPAAAAPAGPPTLKLGEINARLGPLSITAEGLAQLGFPVVATDRGAKLYRESDWIAMVDAMTAHLEDNVRAGVRKVVA